MSKERKEIIINETKKHFSAYPSDRLLDVLRDNGHQIIKEGCGEGICGACSIIWNGKLINSCLTLFGQLRDGDKIITAELDDKLMNKLKDAYANTGAVQCGFCTPGMLTASYALLSTNKNPNEDEIKHAISGNLCRCTGYVKIIEAIKLCV